MASIRENERDAAIIDAILEQHKYLANKRGSALRFALEFWQEAQERARAAQPQRPAPQAEIGARDEGLGKEEGDGR